MYEVPWTFQTFHDAKIFLSFPNISLHKNILSLEVSACNFIKKESSQVFYCKFYEISKKHKDPPHIRTHKHNKFETVTAAFSKFEKILVH